jgi:hypothetical protein
MFFALSLPLLVFGVGTNYHDPALSLYDLTFLAARLY